MSLHKKISFCLFSALLLTTAAKAEISLNGARIGAEDVPALAKFYQSALGLQEVNRITAGGGPEIMLNFGRNANAAKTNIHAEIVIMHRDHDAIAKDDPVPHLILNVTDIKAVMQAVQDAGGTVKTAPRAFGDSGLTIGILADPAGNLVELIQAAKN